MSQFLTLKQSECKSCYKCTHLCPVKAIDGNQCILCGQCVTACSHNTKIITDSTHKAKELLKSSSPVFASVAPSFIANYNGIGFSYIKAALKRLGFTDAEETAIGATIVKNTYEAILKENNRTVTISSCCHSINLLIKKYFPNISGNLADVVSPMLAHSMDIKKRFPNAKTVFIGPCVAKKDEAEYSNNIVDVVLTFDELSRWFKDEGIEPEPEKDYCEEGKTRLFPTVGGIIKSMSCHQQEYTYIAIDGVKNCIEALRDIEKGQFKNCFIEMSACVGSCIGGPAMEKRMPLSNYINVTTYAGTKDFKVTQWDSSKLKKSTTHVTESNISVCLPVFMEKAENFSDNIILNSPNGVIVLNEHLEVQRINNAAVKILKIRSADDILGEQVIRILDPKAFVEVRETGRSILEQRVYLAEYDKFVEQTILFNKEYRMLVYIMRDVTKEEKERKKKDEFDRHTIEIADKVVDKQMRVVQEIASLLGETAAETKIALTKLKESISNE